MGTIQKKVCMLGSFAVGKTSLVRRYVEGRFDDRYLSTIGVKISRRTVAADDAAERPAVNLIIWDLAGGDEFLRSNSGYLRGAAGALLVCDLTRPETLETLVLYAAELRRVNPAAGMVLLGNKHDLADDCVLTADDLATVAVGFSAPVFLTSALTGAYVEEAFARLAERITA